MRILSLGAVIFGIVDFVEKLSAWNESSTRDWIALVIWPFFTFIFLFILPTLRVTLDEHGVFAYWKVGVGPLKLWELKNFHFRWQDILHVYSLNPRWFPLHMIGIIGFRGEKRHMFFIGSLMTHKKKALLYLADHVGKGVIDQEVKNMIQRYRKQLQSEAEII